MADKLFLCMYDLVINNGNIGLQSNFKGRDTKLARFLAKNKHTHGKLLYFDNEHRTEV